MRRDLARDSWLVTETVKRRARPMRDAVVDRFPTLRERLTRRQQMQSLRKQRFYWTDPERPLAPLPYSEAFVRALVEEIGGFDRTGPVLEVGCGMGLTLAALVEHGFEDVTGVEINPLVVDRMRLDHPELADVPVLIGPAEEVLTELPDDSFGLIVAVRTLQHTHPDSAHLFATLARLAPVVISVDEAPFLGRHTYPWNLAQEFGRHGMRVERRRMLDVDGRPTSSVILTMRR